MNKQLKVAVFCGFLLMVLIGGSIFPLYETKTRLPGISGDVLGAGAEKLLAQFALIRIPSESDLIFLAKEIKRTIPTSTDDGDWPDNPCK